MTKTALQSMAEKAPAAPELDHYGRFYARSEKHLTEVLDRVAGKGNWIKTKVMIDSYGNAHQAIEGRDPAPVFPDEAGENNGWLYSKQVYRGVIFRDGNAASKVRLFVNAVADQTPEDKVLVRNFNTAVVSDRARIYGLPATGLPWETKQEAHSKIVAIKERQEASARQSRAEFEANLTDEDRAKRKNDVANFKARWAER